MLHPLFLIGSQVAMQMLLEPWMQIWCVPMAAKADGKTKRTG